MEYVYAALLLHNSGKEITEDSVSAVIEAAGVDADKGKIKGLISALSDVNIDEAMTQAQPAYAPAPVAPQAPAAAPEAEKAGKEEKKKETKEEVEKAEGEGMEGLASLFG